ncbi:PREDICTED: aspartyl/asparaginyl beta-hydroxylase-like [Amphimedon queenslandica]|uniref:Uncharacterized protein n=1 Tax=Amphimedon queenslandica TaxID=400682 RepID=A0A1X7TFM1_AMPQE|nr:PREDICTED: aspartyl/asparaginyl beta-hydroxylase-like [Amphimedon queenslandica]|eukprot:XP_011407658.2 PREDICTED: aspartyl/asparaginyl beta-hydroxylase-like [Amphimedon queenslandica]
MASSTVRQRSVGEELKDKRKEQRHLKKIKDDAETKRKRKIILWIVALTVLLSLSVYYYNYKPSKGRQQMHSPIPQQAPSSGINDAKSSNQSTTKSEPSSKKSPSTKEQSSKSKSKKNKSSSEKVSSKKEKASPKKEKASPTKSQKSGPASKSREELLKTKISDLPILRRPVPPSDPDRPLIMEILEADDYLKGGYYSEALDKFKKVLKRFKQSPRGLLGKALALEGLGKTKGSIKYLDKAIDIYYQISFEASSLANDDIKLAALMGLADCAERREKTTMLIKALKKAVVMEPMHEVYATKLAQAYMKGGQMEEAEKLLEDVINKWPGNSLAHANLGYLHYKGGRFDKAMPHLVKGLSENREIQKNPKFYLYTGETLSRLDKTEEAGLVYAEGVARGFFPSVDQRSLYNEPDLEARPWWKVNEVGEQVLVELEKMAPVLKSELMSAIETNADMFSDANQTQIILISKGKWNKRPCTVLPTLCQLLHKMPSATKCRRGEVSF